MRICMVISVPLPPEEGIGHYVWNLSRFLVRTGHEVQIITRAERGKPPCEVMEGIRLWRPIFYPVYPLHIHLHRPFVQRLVRHLQDQVDLFHLHTPLPPPLQTRRPQFLTVHTPMKAEARAIKVDSFRSLMVRAWLPVSIRVEYEILSRADKIVSVAFSVAEELGEYGVDPEQVEALGNGVDIDLFRPVEQNHRERSSEQYVLAAGRLDVRKGFEDLVEAMPCIVRQFPGVCLYIAGAGPMEERLRARAGQLGLDRLVQFLGHVERDRMLALYRGATIFAHAAHYEGLPTVLLEAMACGRAIVSTGVSGALDVVEDDVNGLLVPARSPQALADAICHLLGDSSLRTRLGSAARRTVEGRYSWRAVGSSYLRCYQALLDGNHR